VVAGSDAPATGVSLVGGRDDKGVTPNERIKNLVELRADGPGTGYSVSDVEVIPSNARGQKVCLLSIGGRLPCRSAGLAVQLAVPAIRVSHN